MTPKRRFLGRTAVALAIASSGLVLSPAVAGADEVTLLVDSLDYVGDDANPGDGVCATDDETPVCTLRAALQESNELNAAAEHDVTITFAEGVEGWIVGPNGNNDDHRMLTGIIASGFDHSGAFFHVTAPVTIDFADRVGFVQYGDEGTGFFIDAPDVTIRNFTLETETVPLPDGIAGPGRQVAGIIGGESAFVVSGAGDRLTLETGKIWEIDSIWLERAVLLLDGADDVTLDGIWIDDPWGGNGGVLTEPNAEISGLTITRSEFRNEGNENYRALATTGGDTVLNDLTITDTVFSDFIADRIILAEQATINGATITGNTVSNYPPGLRHAFDFEGADLSDVTISGNTFDEVDADRIFDLTGTTLDTVTFDGNTFTDNEPLNVWDVRNAEVTDLAITNNVIDGLVHRGAWNVVDIRSADIAGFDYSGNTITNSEIAVSTIDLRGSANSSDISITGNTWSNSSGAHWPSIWLTHNGTNDVVSGNSWVNDNPADKYAWVFVFDGDGNTANVSTGWAFRDNNIAVASANNEAPVRIDTGRLPVERNTFANPARGTTEANDDAALSETGPSWFVWNASNFANGRARTWYPTAVDIDEVAGLASITVTPPKASEGETPAPGGPVDIDVYYTPGVGSERQADRYLGRLEDVAPNSTHVLACAGCAGGGYLRVQTIAANGATTQYSRLVLADEGTVTEPEEPEEPTDPTCADQATPNRAYICQLYLDVLLRGADPTGLNGWSTYAGNVGRTPAAVGIMTGNLEYRTILVREAYQRFLHRAPDAAGLAGFRNLLFTGTLEQVHAGILASAEYGGTNHEWVVSVYQDLLGRAPEPGGAATWEAALAAGQSRYSVALSIATSFEARGKIVADWYTRFLRRPVDQAGRNHHRASLAAGVPQHLVLAEILGSPEYLAFALAD